MTPIQFTSLCPWQQCLPDILVLCPWDPILIFLFKHFICLCESYTCLYLFLFFFTQLHVLFWTFDGYIYTSYFNSELQKEIFSNLEIFICQDICLYFCFQCVYLLVFSVILKFLLHCMYSIVSDVIKSENLFLYEAYNF